MSENKTKKRKWLILLVLLNLNQMPNSGVIREIAKKSGFKNRQCEVWLEFPKSPKS